MKRMPGCQGSLCAALIVSGCVAQGGRKPPIRGNEAVARLERRLPTLLDSAGIPGLAVAMVSDGKLRWARGFGTRQAGTSALVGANTLFEAASLSKPVTLCRAEARGRRAARP